MLMGPNQERGIFRTTRWRQDRAKVLGKDENTGAIDVVSIRIIRTPFSPHSGRCAGSRLSPAGVKGAGFIAPLTAATPGNICRGMVLPEGILGRIGVTV